MGVLKSREQIELEERAAEVVFGRDPRRMTAAEQMQALIRSYVRHMADDPQDGSERDNRVLDALEALRDHPASE